MAAWVAAPRSGPGPRQTDLSASLAWTPRQRTGSGCRFRQTVGGTVDPCRSQPHARSPRLTALGAAAAATCRLAGDVHAPSASVGIRRPPAYALRALLRPAGIGTIEPVFQAPRVADQGSLLRGLQFLPDLARAGLPEAEALLEAFARSPFSGQCHRPANWHYRFGMARWSPRQRGPAASTSHCASQTSRARLTNRANRLRDEFSLCSTPPSGVSGHGRASNVM